MSSVFGCKWLGGEAGRRRTHNRPRIERLEDRCVPSLVTQLTNTFADSPGLGWLSPDGSRAAYVAEVNPTGQNVDHRSEVFLYDAASGTTTQITDGAFPAYDLIGGGTKIAFVSDADLVPGKNTSHDMQVFLYDTTTGTFTQATPAASTVNSPYYTNFGLSADGTALALESDSDLVAGKNAQHARQLFLYGIAGRTLTQVTSGNGYNSGTVVLSARGTALAFESSGDLVPGYNPHGYTELFRYSVAGGVLTQITPGSEHVAAPAPALSADGTKIAFATSANLTGHNPNHVPQVFLYDAITGQTVQVTALGGMRPTLSPDGTKLTLVSSLDLQPGKNPKGFAELFVYDTAGAFTQVTPGAGPYSGATPVFSADGTRLAYVSDADPVGLNGGHDPQVFLYQLARRKTTQATRNVESFDFNPVLVSANGSVLALQSSADLSGQNAAHARQVFLTDTATGTSVQLTHGGAADNAQPFVSANGTTVAFQSDADLTGRNSGGNAEVFLKDTAKGRITQLTPGSSNSYLLVLSPDGTAMALQSDADLVPGHNPDHRDELFLYNLGTGVFTQVTSGAGTYATIPDPNGVGPPPLSAGPSLAAGGAGVAYLDSANPTGPTPNAIQELFFFNAATGSTTQVTHGGASVFALSADGKTLAFVSAGDLVPGQNPGHASEVFLYNTATGAFTPETALNPYFADPPALSADGTKLAFIYAANLASGLDLYDLTTGMLSPVCSQGLPPTFTTPVLSPDGSRLAFISNGDLVPGKNPQGFPQLFVYNSVSKRYTQVTPGDAAGLSDAPVFSPDGSQLAFVSSDDLVPGQNPNHCPQVFLYNLSGSTLAQDTRANAPGVYVSGTISLSAGGRALVFASNGDVTGQNADGNYEIFLVSGAGVTGGPAFSSLTHSPAISYGTATVLLSGVLSGAAANAIVSINAGRASTTATVGAKGAFSATLNTGTLAASPAPYAITYSYAGKGNAAANTTTTLTINKAKPSFSRLAPAPTTAFGATLLTLSGKLTAGTAVPAGDTVTVTAGSASATASVAADGSFSAALPTAGLLVAASPLPVSYSFAGDENFVSTANTATRLTVTRAMPSFSMLMPRVIAYGTATVILAGKLLAGTAAPAGDTVTVTAGGASATARVQMDGTFSTALNTGTLPAAAVAYPVTYSFTGDSNFNAVKDRTTGLTVNKAVPSLGDLTPSRTVTYGTRSVSLSGVLSDVPAGSPVTISAGGATATTRVGRGGRFSGVLSTAGLTASSAPYAVAYSFGGSANFAAVGDGSTALTVIKAAPTFRHLTPSHAITFGTTSTTLSGVLPRGAAGGLVTIVVGSASATTTVGRSGRFSASLDTSTLAASATPYPITYSYGGNPNYDALDNTARRLTVAKATQTIVLGRLPNRFPGDAFALSATAGSGLPVTFRVSGPAKLAGNVLTVTGPGLVRVRATQPGSSNYKAAAVSRSFFVARNISATVSVHSSEPQFVPGSAGLSTVFLTLMNKTPRTLTDALQLVLANLPDGDSVTAAAFGTRSLAVAVSAAGNPVISIPRGAYASLAPRKSLRIKLVFKVTAALSYDVQTFKDVGF
jgi:Tol biopolymer transport system component